MLRLPTKQSYTKMFFYNTVVLVPTRERFLDSYQELVGSLHQWPPEFAGLFRDINYQRPWRRLDPAQPDAIDSETLRHLSTELREWEGTNLRKFLRLSSHKARPQSAGAGLP